MEREIELAAIVVCIFREYGLLYAQIPPSPSDTALELVQLHEDESKHDLSSALEGKYMEWLCSRRRITLSISNNEVLLKLFESGCVEPMKTALWRGSNPTKFGEWLHHRLEGSVEAPEKKHQRPTSSTTLSHLWLAAGANTTPPTRNSGADIVRLNDDSLYVEILESLLWNPPINGPDVDVKTTYIRDVSSAAFLARRYDVAEECNRRLLAYYAPKVQKESARSVQLLHCCLSESLARQGKLEEAEKEAWLAIELYPSSLLSRFILATRVFENGREQDALAAR